jgi:hypothetical protein
MPKPFHHHHKRRSNQQSSSSSVKRLHQQDDYVPENYLQLIRAIGNNPEEIEKWRAERRLKYPRQQITSKPPEPIPAITQSSSSAGLSALFAAYDTDEEDSSTTAKNGETETPKVELVNVLAPGRAPEHVHSNSTANDEKPRVCVYFSRNGRCKYGEKCRNQHIQTSAVPSHSSSRSEPMGKEKNVTAKLSVPQQRVLLEKLLEDVGYI